MYLIVDHTMKDSTSCLIQLYLTQVLKNLWTVKAQIMQLTKQVDNIFSTLDHSNSKCTKRGINHSIFNFLFGDSNSAKEIIAIKNNMTILEQKQDILNSKIQEPFNFIHLTYTETDTNRLLLKSLQKDILQINSTVHHYQNN